MVNELIILGILHDKRMSGYDIKKLCETKFIHYSDVNTSSIYFSLKKLERQKLIEGKNVSGGHMIKKVFTITGAGKKELKESLVLHLSKSRFPKDSFNAGMSFANVLDKKTLKDLLLKRVGHFQKNLKTMREVKKRNLKRSVQYSLLFERGIMHMKTEIKWAKLAIKRLEKN